MCRTMENSDPKIDLQVDGESMTVVLADPDDYDNDSQELDPFRDYLFEQTQRFDPLLIHVEGFNVFYRGRIGIDPMGSYMGGHELTERHYYVYFDVVDIYPGDNMSLGLCSDATPLDKHIGLYHDSIGIQAIDLCLYISGKNMGKIFDNPIEMGDTVGFGINFSRSYTDGNGVRMLSVFIVYNNVMIGTYQVPKPYRGFYGAVGLHSHREEVKFEYDWNFTPLEVDESQRMDSNEDVSDWARLDDVFINGCNLEYSGEAKSIVDVGLAQARYPLTTVNHFFEMKIVNPGKHCYIAIGLATRSYPKHRHPGWDGGSIGYHADDGKLFNGSGTGEEFGPACSEGDRMGCGIIFPDPTDDCSDSESNTTDSGCANGEANDLDRLGNGDLAVALISSVPLRPKEGIQVRVYFTHNGDMIGERTMLLPKEGFFPTIGMLSAGEVVCPILNGCTG